MICPNCNSKNIAKYLYGLPDFEDEKLRKKIKKEKIVLGGCDLFDGEPLYHCNECQHDWGELQVKENFQDD